MGSLALLMELAPAMLSWMDQRSRLCFEWPLRSRLSWMWLLLPRALFIGLSESVQVRRSDCWRARSLLRGLYSCEEFSRAR